MKNSTAAKWAPFLALQMMLSLCLGVAWAHSPDGGIVEIVIKANHDGFFDSKGNPLREISIPEGKTVRLVFRYDESTVDAYRTGNRHQLVVASEKTGFRVEAEEISYWKKEASVEFTAGKDGSKEYRIVCILDCEGMENLGYQIPLILTVV